MLFQSFVLDYISLEHSNVSFSILDFIGSIGGVFEMLSFVVGLLMYPYVSQSFKLRVMKSLYKVRSLKNDILEDVEPRPDPETGKVKKNVRF